MGSAACSALKRNHGGTAKQELCCIHPRHPLRDGEGRTISPDRFCAKETPPMFEKPLISLENWPVLVICVGMLAAAIIDWWKFKVPNKLTFPLIIAGWILGLCNNFGLEAGHGGIGAALAGTFLGMALLLPVYAIGGMGAGDVKMTMGFGSWIGAFFGFGDPTAVPPVPNGMWIITYAFCA